MIEKLHEIGDVVSERPVEQTDLYDVVVSVIKTGNDPGDTIEEVSIMSKSGDYAGSSRDVREMFDRMGIAPEKRCAENYICSVGWSERNQKWYGWSHRVISGFGIGDDYYKKNYKIETNEQAHESACSFAEAVS